MPGYAGNLSELLFRCGFPRKNAGFRCVCSPAMQHSLLLHTARPRARQLDWLLFRLLPLKPGGLRLGKKWHQVPLLRSFYHSNVEVFLAGFLGPKRGYPQSTDPTPDGTLAASPTEHQVCLREAGFGGDLGRLGMVWHGENVAEWKAAAQAKRCPKSGPPPVLALLPVFRGNGFGRYQPPCEEVPCRAYVAGLLFAALLCPQCGRSLVHSPARGYTPAPAPGVGRREVSWRMLRR